MEYQNLNQKDEQRKAEKRMRTVNLFLFLALIIVMTFFYSKTQSTVGFSFGDEGFTVTTPDNTVMDIHYEDIQSMKLQKLVDTGNCISGKEDKQFRYGTWNNDAWGEYHLCVSQEASLCIVIKQTEKIIAISYEDDAVTASLFESLSQVVQDRNPDAKIQSNLEIP